MKKVIVYVRNKEIRPSDYYRIIQYTKELNANIVIRSAIPSRIDRWCLDSQDHRVERIISLGVCYFFVVVNFLRGYILDCFEKPDIIIVIREIFPRKMPFIFKGMLQKKCRKYKYIWDYDDSIIGLEISNREADIYLKYAKKIVVSTPYLKEMLPVQYRSKTEALCTTDGDMNDVNLKVINAERSVLYEKTIGLVWVGTARNLPNLEDIVSYLDMAAKQLKLLYNKQLRLRVVCNIELKANCKYLNIENVSWTRERAVAEMMNAHIGIMPLIKNDFALGKAGFKLIQYMAAGLPLIASDVGFNETIVSENYGFKLKQKDGEQWWHAIEILSTNLEEWKIYSEESLKSWKERYSYEAHLAYWQNLIDTV